MNGHGGNDTDDGFRNGVDADRRHQQRDDRIAQHGFIGFFEEDPDAAQHADGVDERAAQSAQGCGRTAIFAFEPLIDRAGPIAQRDAREKAISRLVQLPSTPPMEKNGVKQKLVIVGEKVAL